MGTGVGEVITSSASKMQLLSNIDGLTSGGLESVIKGVIIVLIFLWILCIIWVARDISARTNSTLLQVVSVVLVTLFTPIIGLPLYYVVRPMSYKQDLIPRRESAAMNIITCYNCKALNSKEHMCCVVCGEGLKIKCKECSNHYPHDYLYCNSCGAPNLEV